MLRESDSLCVVLQVFHRLLLDLRLDKMIFDVVFFGICGSERWFCLVPLSFQRPACEIAPSGMMAAHSL